MRIPFTNIEIRRVKKNKHTCLHPELKAHCEFAFEIDGREFYQFKRGEEFAILRHQKMMFFMREVDLRMTHKDLTKLIGLCYTSLDKGKLTDCVKYLNVIETAASMHLETDTYYRLFSCVFFDLEEDILDYDYEYNQEKIELFKAQPINSFFLSKPLKEYLPVVNGSPPDLKASLEETKTLQKRIYTATSSSTTKK